MTNNGKEKNMEVTISGKDRYREETIGVDKVLAQTMGSLMEATSAFTDKKFISVHKNSQGEWGVKAADGYLLGSAPIFGDKTVTDPYMAGLAFAKEAHDLGEAVSREFSTSARCVTLSNICDWGRRGNEEGPKKAIRQGLEDGCKQYGIFIAAGESAVLGGRIPDSAILNISGAATIAIPRKKASPMIHGFEYKDKTLDILIYDPRGNIIVYRCDGNGNKPRFNMEMRRDGRAVSADTLAMTRDDLGKNRVEEIGNILSVDLARNVHDPFNASFDLGELIKIYDLGVFHNLLCEDIPYSIAYSDITGRLEGYGSMFINPNSTAIGRINESEFFNPPMPKEGDRIVIMRDTINGRSNGWTQLIKDLIAYFHGDPDFHLHSKEGARMLEMAGRGSTIYFDIFQEAFVSGASKVGHLSGGAYNEKFSSIFRKGGLGGAFNNPLSPFSIHLLSRDIQGYSVQALADKYNLCGDAWIAVSEERLPKIISLLERRNLHYAVMGVLEKMDNPQVEINFTHPLVNGTARF